MPVLRRRSDGWTLRTAPSAYLPPAPAGRAAREDHRLFRRLSGEGRSLTGLGEVRVSVPAAGVSVRLDHDDHRRRPSSPRICSAKRGQVELLHRQERLGDSIDLFARAVAEHLAHLDRGDLPGEAVAVLQPATLFGFGHGRQLVPIAVDFSLVGAAAHQRNGLVETEVMPASAVHGSDPGIAETDVGEHDGTRNVGRHALGVADELAAFRVAEHFEVEVRRRFGLATYSPTNVSAGTTAGRGS